MIDTRHHLDFHAIGLSYFTQSESMNYTKIWKPENILILVIDSWLPGKKNPAQKMVYRFIGQGIEYGQMRKIYLLCNYIKGMIYIDINNQSASDLVHHIKVAYYAQAGSAEDRSNLTWSFCASFLSFPIPAFLSQAIVMVHNRAHVRPVFVR